jgi:hypothetical protein
MNRSGDIIALGVASLGSALLGWAALHIAAKFERKRAIHLLEEHGYAPSNADRGSHGGYHASGQPSTPLPLKTTTNPELKVRPQ